MSETVINMQSIQEILLRLINTKQVLLREEENGNITLIPMENANFPIELTDLEINKKIQAGLDDIAAGRVFPMDEVFAELDREFDI
ncbi:MAG: hypothetical protein FWF08_04005 [Oscillospiraceae bacterium]|nr:hypothetical protein [Oscillospiraceae bacterium]